MATALHPQFKVSWLKKGLQVELYTCRRYVQVIDAKKLLSQHHFLLFLLLLRLLSADDHKDKTSAFFNIFGEDRMENLVNAGSFVTTYLTKPAGSAWKGEVLTPLFMKQVFIKNNTLLSSSTAVEHLFFTGKVILRPKRSQFEDAKFDKSMFLLANWNVKALT